MNALAEPMAAERAATDEETVHVVCCDENLALCGKTLVGEFQPDEVETTCPICAIADEEDLPCGDPACPVRDGAR